ncbi:hypothetical protein A2863_03995 [Candidatus Woesebacteria bacterium RIFCSPHIGHO2_01_FULL_38_9b]|uniref:DUF86 domain-containing protein n=1 Tax=Candidatus Woesebacteria bacterium RIFCSPHIGHO2_01_FULL_38_9b TaxID=1802493 RepID=A0A1F7Y4C5_9BACT|nr:MAG: hypothetical protein A2863_03995 [Candidatus Woesebacteria bacterium RIFCSPHIGHO2_01_FULL_38_9b]
MSKLPTEYLKHIRDELNYLKNTSSSIDEKRFMHDPTFQRAFARSLSVIGEAVKKLSPEFREKHAEVEWKTIAGMRDRLIHEYFGVDYEIVWDVVVNEVPKFKEQIEKLLNEE